MKATESPLVNLLKGPRQFLIPIYQRAYSWGEEQCAQLWDDVLRVAGDDRFPAHFIGSVVYIEHRMMPVTAVPQLLVIDGQQRLTTFTLMIEALARALEAGDDTDTREISARKLRNYFLLNTEEDGDLRYKLQLSQCDTPTLRALIDRKALPEQPAPRLVENFEYFQDQVQESDVPPEVLYRGLTKLVVVDVGLDRQHDNPQLIFESLNSTGLDLSQSDLIRNYVLMGLEPAQQAELYQDHWRPMERTLSRAGREGAFDRFLRAWLTLRLGEVPNIRRGYETFKRYSTMSTTRPVPELLGDLHRLAEYYACIALGKEEHPALARVFRGLQALRIDAPLPFLMHAYSLWKDGQLPEGDMIRIAQLMESWLFRRAVCDVPSNVLSRTFAALPGQLDDERLLESFLANLILRTGRQRFPKDDEFRTALETRNLYEFKHRQYCLTRLENDGRKELVDIGEYTVEHVLPQNEKLSSEWRAMLGPNWSEVQDRWLHTLGNLTLTGYNPELSDRPFLEKCNMTGGFAESPLRLNQSLAKLEAWNEEEIEARAQVLARKALRIWSAPSVDDETLVRYRTERGKTKKLVPRVNVDHFGMSEDTLEIYEALLEGSEVVDLGPTIWRYWIGLALPGEGRPYPVVVRPRKGWLLLGLRVAYDDLVHPPEIAFPFESRTGKPRTRAKVKTLEDVAECLRLLPQIPGVVRDADDPGADNPDETEEDDA